MISEYEHDNPGRGPSPRRLLWRVLGWAAIGLAMVLVGTSLTAYGAYRKLQGNINHEDVGDQLGAHRPPKLNHALNVLLIGSDQRNGANARYGKAEGERSDTIILLHLSPGGKKAVGISFPRDSMVQLPECKSPSGKIIPAHFGMINESFNDGGAGCTWRTIESLTKIHIDHFAKVDFSGFKRVVDALGGVQICLPQRVDDQDSGLHLSAGRHVVKGDQALAYVRNRHGLGDGSDLGRIQRQQKFLGAVVKKATSGGVLTNPGRMYAFLNAATKSVTTDKDFTVDEMKKVAGSVRGISAGKVQFVTVPWMAYAPDPNRVAWRQPDANKLFSAIRNDNQVQAPAPATPPPSVPASQVKVRVLNATGTAGLAARVRGKLTARGYQVIKVGNVTGTPPSTTRLLFGAGADKQAATLATLVPGAHPGAGPDTAAGTVDLILGPDWHGLKSVHPTAISKSLNAVNAAEDPCAAR